MDFAKDVLAAIVALPHLICVPLAALQTVCSTLEQALDLRDGVGPSKCRPLAALYAQRIELEQCKQAASAPVTMTYD